MTAAEIAESLAMPLSTVSAVLTRIGLGKRSRLEPPRAAEPLRAPVAGRTAAHIDVKKLGKIGCPSHRVNSDRRSGCRGVGWEYVHICVEDATRLADVRLAVATSPWGRTPFFYSVWFSTGWGQCAQFCGRRRLSAAFPRDLAWLGKGVEPLRPLCLVARAGLFDEEG